MDFAELAAALAGRVRGRSAACGSVRVTAIDGRSGAGKTSLALSLADELGAPILHLERLYPGWGGLAKTPPMVRDLLAQLAIGERGTATTWDWVAAGPGGTLSVLPTTDLIIEGVGAGARILRPFLSQLVWVQSPADVRRARAIARDGEVYAPHWDTWAAQEVEYLSSDRTREVADVVIRT